MKTYCFTEKYSSWLEIRATTSIQIRNCESNSNHMKFISIIIFLLVYIHSNAQKRQFALSINTGLYIGYSDGASIGPGFELKAARQLSEKSQLTLSAGFLRLKTFRRNFNEDYTNTRLTLGYRRFINSFYLEPRVGLGEMGGRFSIGGDYSRPSVLALFIALDMGYNFRRLFAGFELSNGAFGIASKEAGFWHNRKLFYSGLKIGFNLIKP
jgi:hypothetical protein